MLTYSRIDRMKNIILVSSIVLLAIVVFNMAVWIIVASNTSSFRNASNLYNSYINEYPKVLRSPTRITLLNILLGILGGIGFLFIRNPYGKASSIILNFLAVFAFVLALWQLFSLM